MEDVKMVKQMDKTCENCICSVCLVAESNGGAPGCGNCMECNTKNPVTSCKEFWCPLRFVPYKNKQKERRLKSLKRNTTFSKMNLVKGRLFKSSSTGVRR